MPSIIINDSSFLVGRKIAGNNSFFTSRVNYQVSFTPEEVALGQKYRVKVTLWESDAGESKGPDDVVAVLTNYPINATQAGHQKNLVWQDDKLETTEKGQEEYYVRVEVSLIANTYTKADSKTIKGLNII